VFIRVAVGQTGLGQTAVEQVAVGQTAAGQLPSTKSGSFSVITVSPEKKEIFLNLWNQSSLGI
jgi:hypothetical protein